jgi:hypothetical protein
MVLIFDNKVSADCCVVGSQDFRLTHYFEIMLLVHFQVMSLVSLSHLLSGNAVESLRSSQKAVHMFPDIPENWVVLIASFMPKCIHQQSSEDALWLKRLISHVRRKLDASRQMSHWLSNHERKVTLIAEEYRNH